mmetsp:Transcript_66716/g.211087  ORF Transcript_66716/g.211087 Transcript_66716/m.211087 type:complete len:235 (-) Transcript_66716:241-945(-)
MADDCEDHVFRFKFDAICRDVDPVGLLDLPHCCQSHSGVHLLSGGVPGNLALELLLAVVLRPDVLVLEEDPLVVAHPPLVPAPRLREVALRLLQEPLHLGAGGVLGHSEHDGVLPQALGLCVRGVTLARTLDPAGEAGQRHPAKAPVPPPELDKGHQRHEELPRHEIPRGRHHAPAAGVVHVGHGYPEEVDQRHGAGVREERSAPADKVGALHAPAAREARLLRGRAACGCLQQ